jgi:hypothetical protein
MLVNAAPASYPPDSDTLIGADKGFTNGSGVARTVRVEPVPIETVGVWAQPERRAVHVLLAKCDELERTQQVAALRPLAQGPKAADPPATAAKD